MSRVSKQLAIENRKNIESITSHLIREQGFAISVADLMKAAGLTHGGFYKHFQSKDELLDIACKNTFDQSVLKWQAIISETKNEEQALKLIIERYLSEKNLKDPASSCPLSSLTIDVAREAEDKPVKQSFNQGVEALLEILNTLNVQKEKGQLSEQQAIIQLSLLSGALTLARSVQHERGMQIIETVKQYLFESI